MILFLLFHVKLIPFIYLRVPRETVKAEGLWECEAAISVAAELHKSRGGAQATKASMVAGAPSELRRSEATAASVLRASREPLPSMFFLHPWESYKSQFCHRKTTYQ